MECDLSRTQVAMSTANAIGTCEFLNTTCVIISLTERSYRYLPTYLPTNRAPGKSKMRTYRDRDLPLNAWFIELIRLPMFPF